MKRADRSAVIAKLLETGWRIDHVIGSDDVDWWVNEIWVLQSVWAPNGFAVYLSWMTDPQSERDVWEVVASTRPLADRLEAKDFGPRMDARPLWNDLDIFTKELSSLRDASR